MPAFSRILAAYENGLKKLADELVAEIDPPEEERAHLVLVSRMLQAVVSSYDSFQLNRASLLEAGKPLASSSTAPQERRVLNVTLRSLVDNDLMTPWYARFINSNLGLKRTTIISGGPNVGKSTLLNALIDMLPRDHRIVVVDDSEEELPTLRDRSFTVQLKAKRGTPARAAVFRKAADMKPVWIVVGELVRRDGPVFLDAVTEDCSGLTTVQTTDPEATLNDWLSMNKSAGEHLRKINPLVVHLERDEGERPRVERVIEVTTDKGKVAVTLRKPVEGEQGAGGDGGDSVGQRRDDRRS